jgi:DsbC/DsbD-like thiol-disulfide interchange protein
MKFRRIHLCLVLGVCLCGMSAAQGPIQPVQWSSATVPKAPVKPGNKITVELSAEIQDGWHVYGFTQVSGGPIPLRVLLDENGTVEASSVVSGTAPVKKHDPSFNLDTECYVHSLALHLPVRVKQHASTGNQSIPVSIRFQACSDRICLPPRTVHLTVPVEILAGT